MTYENTETIKISDIHIHPDIQVRTTINDDAVERYTELYEADSKALPPIKICVSQEDQHFYLIDGHHRLQAAKKAGLQFIQVIELGELSLKEMIHKSIEANGQQGIALSKADRKRAAEMLAKYDVNITVRDVAKRVGLSKSTVATILKEYREKTVVKCAECGATVLRLYADDSTNGWIEVQEAKKSKWFCSEDHRREFFAKQAEKEAARKAKREEDEEQRNSRLDEEEDKNGRETDNFYDSIPESEKDYDPKFKDDPGFHLAPCYKCGSRAFYTHPVNQNHLVTCSDSHCPAYDIWATDKDTALYNWNHFYEVNEKRDQHETCPVCGSLPLMHVSPDCSHPYRVVCENPRCGFGTDHPFLTSAPEAWRIWDEAVTNQTRKDFEYQDRYARQALEQLEKPSVTFIPNEAEDNEDDDNVEISDDLKPCPFCGHQPSMFHYHDDGKWNIECTHKDCTMNAFTPMTDSKEEAVKQWNSRLSDAAQENSFAEKLLKFLLKGYKWKQNGHEFTLQLQPNAFAGKPGFLTIRAGGLKGCAAIQSTYILPDFKKEAEK